MSIVVEATFENGVLRPLRPLPFVENQHVRLTIDAISTLAQQSAGLVPWHGDTQTLERLAMDPELAPENSP